MVACLIPTLLGAFFQQEKSSIKRIMQHRLLQEETRIKKQEMQFQSCEAGGGVLLSFTFIISVPRGVAFTLLYTAPIILECTLIADVNDM